MRNAKLVPPFVIASAKRVTSHFCNFYSNFHNKMSKSNNRSRLQKGLSFSLRELSLEIDKLDADLNFVSFLLLRIVICHYHDVSFNYINQHQPRGLYRTITSRKWIPLFKIFNDDTINVFSFKWYTRAHYKYL